MAVKRRIPEEHKAFIAELDRALSCMVWGQIIWYGKPPEAGVHALMCVALKLYIQTNPGASKEDLSKAVSALWDDAHKIVMAEMKKRNPAGPSSLN